MTELLPQFAVDSDRRKSTDMTITGTMNPEDDTIFLKVQITDKDGKLLSFFSELFTLIKFSDC